MPEYWYRNSSQAGWLLQSVALAETLASEINDWSNCAAAVLQAVDFGTGEPSSFIEARATFQHAVAEFAMRPFDQDLARSITLESTMPCRS
ncbi:MAG: hypothetical protein KDB22_20860 [Planctomycetales bacterium]|nr:hypothetical protein [Planctomycetales bacterium]